MTKFPKRDYRPYYVIFRDPSAASKFQTDAVESCPTAHHLQTQHSAATDMIEAASDVDSDIFSVPAAFRHEYHDWGCRRLVPRPGFPFLRCHHSPVPSTVTTNGSRRRACAQPRARSQPVASGTVTASAAAAAFPSDRLGRTSVCTVPETEAVAAATLASPSVGFRATVAAAAARRKNSEPERP